MSTLAVLAALKGPAYALSEVIMNSVTQPGVARFLKGMAALGAIGLPFSRSAAAKTTYDPGAKFEITVSEVEFRKTAAGRQLMARIYQPSGPGPFPTVLDLHGGAWNAKDR